MSDSIRRSQTPEPVRYDPEMERLLQEMLDRDEDITARGVIRLHSTLRAASSITRNPNRTALLEAYKARQQDYRDWKRRLSKRSPNSAAMSIAEKDLQIEQLEREVEILTASHVAMIRAVGELGGFAAWDKFFADYHKIRTELVAAGQQLPVGAHGETDD